MCGVTPILENSTATENHSTTAWKFIEILHQYLDNLGFCRNSATIYLHFKYVQNDVIILVLGKLNTIYS